MRILLASAFGLVDPNVRQQLDSSGMCLLLGNVMMEQNGLFYLVPYGFERIETCHRILHDHSDLSAAYRKPILLRLICGKIDDRLVSVPVAAVEHDVSLVYVSV